MAEKPADNPQDASKQALDLNSLSGLDFGPSWADENARKKGAKRFDNYEDKRGGDRGKQRRPGGGSKDRRPAGGRRPEGGSGQDRREGGQRGQGHGRRRHDGGRRPQFQRDTFEPTVKVDLYPQDEAFDALVQRLQSSARTYQLFEIAHLLLEKPERFVAVVSAKPKKAAAGESADSDLLYFSVPGHLPFDSEEEAISHVLANNLDLFFDIEEIEVEPPKGNFQMVNRCTITGDLLGPPNYHRYQEFLQRHYSNRICGMSYDRFVSKIEGVKEQEQIDAWVESMKKGARYTVKDRAEGEPESLESLEAVRYFLLQHRKDKVVGSGNSVRFAGRDIERLPKGSIRRSVEHYVEQQRHFPLDTANNIRGRLRRHKFTVYKKGSKGVSYVCAVKRKFRDSQSSFTESIQDLILFLEKNADILASKLPQAYIGIDTEKKTPEKLEMAEAEKAAEAVETATAETPASEAPAVEVVEAAEPVEATEPAPATEPAAKPAESTTDATPVSALSDEDQKRLNQLMVDLRWLITEGYVTEYGDGRLFAPPPMPEPKKKEAPAPAEAPVAEALAAEEAAAVEAPVEAAPTEVATEAPVVEAETASESAEAPAADTLAESASTEEASASDEELKGS